MAQNQLFSVLQSLSRVGRIALPALVLLTAGPAPAEDVGTSAVPYCIGRPEARTWFNSDPNATPTKIDVQVTCDSSSEFYVLMYDAHGHVADSYGDYHVTSDGRQWLRVEPWSDGDYIEHVWLLLKDANTARVWIDYEPLDGSPGFEKNQTFSRTAPSSPLGTGPVFRELVKESGVGRLFGL